MDEIRVEVIAEIEEEVRQLSKVVKEKEKTLKGYQDLPPVSSYLAFTCYCQKVAVT